MSVLNVNRVADASGGVLAPISSVMRNRIINGAMVIDQRNAGASVNPTDGQYTLDRWAAFRSQASKYTVQQNAGSVTPPVGFKNYLGVTSSSAYSVTSSDYFLLAQYIEGLNCTDLGWGTANAKTVTLSFQVYSSLTGTFGGALQNAAQNRSYPFTYTISAENTWTTASVTIAGDTSGTWLTTNGAGISVFFGLGMGSTYSGTAGAWAGSNFYSATGATSVVGTNGATFYITGVQLEVGTQATSFEYRQYQQELALCYRYYQQLGALGWITAVAYSTNRVLFGIPTLAPMRATPTISSSATAGIYFSAGTAQTSTVTNYAGQSANGTIIQCDFTVSAANQSVGVMAISAGVQISAEL